MRWRITAAVGLIGLTSACARPSSTDAEVLVAAASSLTNAFQELEVLFELANPDVDLVVTFAGSSELREQILNGAPIDVFASADVDNMQQVVDAGMVLGIPASFATNRMVLAVALGNPGGIRELADLARSEVLIGLCARQVPCGSYGWALLEEAGIEPSIDTEEPSVRALLTKIELGELDGGLVYASDIAAGTPAGTIPLPADVGPAIEYPIAVLESTDHRELAQAFIDLVTSPEGQEVLAKWGFGSP